MEVNIEEALKAKADAEKRFADKDFVGAKSSALKAEKLCPDLEGIAQMVLTFGVYSAAEMKINGEVDFYAVLGLDPSADKAKVKKQYKKMAVLLHPDKNKSIGADGAFKLVSEAWTVLSDVAKKSSYDHRRNISSMHTASAASHSRLDTFWTVCTSCHVQYEYLRKYVNKRLSCKNCRGVFIAVETGLAPVNGSYQYCSCWVGLLQFGLSLHYLASLSTKRFSVNSNRMYAEKGKKPPPPEVLPIGSRGGRQKCCQSPEGFAAAAGVGSAQCYSCSNSDFRSAMKNCSSIFTEWNMILSCL
nr:Chaperone protein DnaJ [Ipomoea batatas]